MLEIIDRLKLAGLLVAIAIAPMAHAQQELSPIDLPVVTIEQFLPVKTHSLTVGSFEAEMRPTGVSQPFFLVGCDPLSIEWLQMNRARLIELRAFGLVIDAPDVESYRRLESVAEGLILRPVAGDLIAEHLHLRHYPALITADGIYP
jgi:integrating conjugative element protein (TIGR03765 family)